MSSVNLTFVPVNFGNGIRYCGALQDLDTAAKKIMSSIPLQTIEQWSASLGIKTDAFVSFLGIQDVPGLEVSKDTLQGVLAKEQTLKQERYARAAVIAKRAQSAGLGWYTSEVEADELGVGLMALAEFSPKDAIDALFRAGVEDVSSTYAPSSAECRRGFYNNWMHWTCAGKDFVPFFGDLGNPHPSFCFRIFNMDTEILSQGY